MFSDSADPTLAPQPPYGQEKLDDMIQFSGLGQFAEQIEQIDAGLNYYALNPIASPTEWEQHMGGLPADLTFQEADSVTDMVEDSDMVEETLMVEESGDDDNELFAIAPAAVEEADDDHSDAVPLTLGLVPGDENMPLDITDTTQECVWQGPHTIWLENQPDFAMDAFDHPVIEARHIACLPAPAPVLFPEVNDPIFDQSNALQTDMLFPYMGETINHQQNLQTSVSEHCSPIFSPDFGQAGAVQPSLFNGAQFGEYQQLADQQLINLQPLQGFLDLPQQVQANPLSQVPFPAPPPMIIQNFFAVNTINVSHDRRDQVPCQ